MNPLTEPEVSVADRGTGLARPGTSPEAQGRRPTPRGGRGLSSNPAASTRDHDQTLLLMAEVRIPRPASRERARPRRAAASAAAWRRGGLSSPEGKPEGVPTLNRKRSPLTET